MTRLFFGPQFIKRNERKQMSKQENLRRKLVPVLIDVQ